ncbi:MAG: MltA domain-containing protein [Magnetococcales bacterium]|nr:MltA domain-containing protein [Magnetococcales bacterium]
MRFLPAPALWLALGLVFFSSCSSPPPAPPAVTEENSLTLAAWSQVDKVLSQDGDLATWADALEASAAYYEAQQPQDAQVRFGPRTFTVAEMAKACRDLAQAARTLPLAKFHDHLKEHYLLFHSVGSDNHGEVMVTAYFEPLLKGSLNPGKSYPHPLYRRPDNLIEVDLSEWWPDFKGKRLLGRLDKGALHPYYSRAQIDGERVLRGKHLELAWVEDPIDLFFLHVQGSGRISLPDGATLRVGYAGSNGLPYRSIGSLLIDEKEIPKEKMSLPVLRQWLKDNPKQTERVMFSNPSYVFFRKLDGGPYGNIGVPLTGERSMATDDRLFPKGAPGMLYVTFPEFAADDTVTGWRPTLRFTVNQDTGGAIRGPGRVDYFMGFGDKALRTAGIMKQTGASLYFIAPRPPEPKKSFWQRLTGFSN